MAEFQAMYYSEVSEWVTVFSKEEIIWLFGKATEIHLAWVCKNGAFRAPHSRKGQVGIQGLATRSVISWKYLWEHGAKPDVGYWSMALATLSLEIFLDLGHELSSKSLRPSI